MAEESLAKQIHELRQRGIYVGLQMTDAGLYAWMTDRNYKVRVDYLIEEKSAEAVDAILSAWLRSQAALKFPPPP